MFIPPDTEVMQQMWVADIHDQCILGLNFLAPRGCLVNLKDNSLRIGGEEVPLQRLNSELTSPPCCRVILDKTVDLPPYSKSLAPVKIQGHLQTGSGESSSHSIDGVMTGRTLVDLEKPTVPVRIPNLTNKKRIKKGASIAVCEPVQSVMALKEHPGQQQPATKLPTHLQELYQESIDGLTPVQQTQVCNLLCAFSDVLSQGPHDLGRTDSVQHRIDTRDASPIRQPPRQLPLSKQQDAAKMVEDMERE